MNCDGTSTSPSSIWCPFVNKRVLNKKVYDVTNFMYEHPGGKMKILECAGDGKDHWADFLDAEHSVKAKNEMK